MSGYIGPVPVPQGIQNKETFTATAAQTTFNTSGYTDGAFVSVYLNGIRLINGTDYTATNGSDIVLTSGASVDDVLDVESFNSFSLVSQTQTTPTFTTNATLKNNTHEDTDGGRESTLVFKGEQSGGEISTLAAVEASHDGTADDQKGDLIFKTNDGSDNNAPTEAMRIQSDQSILAGSPTTDDDQTFQIIKTGASSTLGIHSNRASAGGSALILSHNRNTSIGSFTALNDDDQLGRITFQGSDGGDIKTEGAQIHAEINGTVGSNDLPTDLVFSTTADGANSITERWRITSEGHLKASANGNGIDFSHTEGSGAASSILDDFEEGSFTPIFSGARPGGGDVTVNTQLGRYTKVGNIVHISLVLGVNGSTVDANNSAEVTITGLPYTIVNIAGQNFVPISMFPQSGWNQSAATQGYVNLLHNNTTNIVFYGIVTDAAVNFNSVQYNQLGRNNGNDTLMVRLNGVYRVAT